MSASELAKIIDVSRQDIYAIETGTYVPNTAIALKMARVLNVTVEDIFRFDAAAVTSRGKRGTDMQLLTLILILMISIYFPVIYLVVLVVCVISMLTTNSGKAKKPDIDEIITLKLR